MTVSGLQPLTISRLLVSVDWLHRCMLPLQVQDRGFRRPRGSSFPCSFTDTDRGSTAIPHYAANIDNVEADEPLNHEQVRDGTDGEAGLLLGVALIAGAGVRGFLTHVGAEMAELHGSPRGGCPHQPAMDLPADKRNPMTPQLPFALVNRRP
jgi:hypothetical protein